MIVCVHSSLIPLQHSPVCGALLWPGGSAVSRGQTCLLSLFCPGATLAPAAGFGAGIQTDQGQEPGKEGRRGNSVLPAGLREAVLRVCTVSCLQEAEGGVWWGKNSARPQMCTYALRCPEQSYAGARPGKDGFAPEHCRTKESHCTFILLHRCSLASPLLVQLCLRCGL